MHTHVLFWDGGFSLRLIGAARDELVCLVSSVPAGARKSARTARENKNKHKQGGSGVQVPEAAR